MKKNIAILCYSLLAVAIISSCKKDKDDEPQGIVGKWKQVSGTYNPTYFGITNYFALYDDCEKDDIIELKANNTWELTEGATKCDPSDPQVIASGSYSVNASLTSITMFGETSAMELSGNTLKTTYTFSDGGSTYTDVSTYQRQ